MTITSMLQVCRKFGTEQFTQSASQPGAATDHYTDTHRRSRILLLSPFGTLGRSGFALLGSSAVFFIHKLHDVACETNWQAVEVVFSNQHGFRIHYARSSIHLLVR